MSPTADGAALARIASFFADAVPDPGHELGPNVKSGAELERLYNCSTLVMEPAPEHMDPGKTCLVTVGATAGFRSLITEMVTPKVVSALAAQGFDSMVVQCGPDFEYFESIRPSDPPVTMEGHSVVDNILDYMTQCCPSNEPPKRSMGLIISHAGAGNLIQAVRLNTKVITVPNTDLMDNHQVELAECLAENGWVIHGQIGHIHEAIEKSVTFKRAPYPPRSPPGSKKRGLEQITQDVVKGTWNDDNTVPETTSITTPAGNFVGTLTEYLRGPLRYIWNAMSARDVGPEYDDEARQGPEENSGQESDGDANSDGESGDELGADAHKPKKLKRVFNDQGDGTSTVTWVPVPENESLGLFGRLFGEASSHDDGRAEQQASGEATQDTGRDVDGAEQHQPNVFGRLFGRVDHDDGYKESDPEVLRHTRLYENVDGRLEDLSRMFIG